MGTTTTTTTTTITTTTTTTTVTTTTTTTTTEAPVSSVGVITELTTQTTDPGTTTNRGSVLSSTVAVAKAEPTNNVESSAFQDIRQPEAAAALAATSAKDTSVFAMAKDVNEKTAKANELDCKKTSHFTSRP